MSSQVTPPTSTPPAPAGLAPSERFRAWYRGGAGPRRPVRYRLLLLVALLLDAGVVALTVSLLGSTHPATPPPARLSVPRADAGPAWDALRGMLVQEDGRAKPFDTFCRESVRAITGRERFEDNDPVAVVVSWMMLDEPKAARRRQCDWEHHPLILCDHPELRTALYRAHRGEDAELSAADLHGRHIEPAVLRHSEVLEDLVRAGAAKTEQDARAALSPLEQKAAEVQRRLALYDRIRAGGSDEGTGRGPGAFGIVALDRHGPAWFSLATVRAVAARPGLWPELMEARHQDDPTGYEGTEHQPCPAEAANEVAAAATALRTAYLGEDSDAFASTAEAFASVVTRVRLSFDPARTPAGAEGELWFNRVNPFRKAWLVGMLAAVLLGLGLLVGGRWAGAGRFLYAVGLLAYLGALGWAGVGFYCRVTISGRPPVSNMYESVIWAAFMTAVFGLFLELFYRKAVIALAGAVVSTFGFVLADQLPLTLPPNIQPLVAVLRSNYWLVIHVLTIVSSYAAFALAWGMGNLNLGLMLLAPGRRDLVKTLSGFCYRAVQIGVVLLAAGTLLGGFWAAESWGRFWGWDPKEVWALVALLCYIIPLHARYAGWVGDFGLALCAVVCFASVVMAWYGVNFILGAGLHSYGFGGGNDRWVYWGGLLNVCLALHAALRYLGARPRVVTPSVP